MHVVDFTTFYPPHVGGVEAYAAALHTEWLRRPGWRVTVVTSDQGGPTPEEGRADDRLRVVTYPLWEPVSGFGSPRGPIGTLADRALVEPPDVVISHTRFYPASWLAGRFARRHGVPWVHVEHGGSAVQSSSAVVRTVASSYDRVLGVPVLRGADRVLSVSAGSADFVRRLSAVEAHVARRGMVLPATAWSAPESPRALFVGRLVDAKGTHETVTALSGLGMPLDVVGEGPGREAMAAEATRLGIEASFHGAVPPDEVQERMRAASVLVHPSHTEGLPTVVLEAAALGMPIIASDVGGTRDIIAGTDDGWLVPSRDPAALRSALEETLADPAASARRGTRARAGVNERFSWDQVIDEITQVAGHA